MENTDELNKMLAEFVGIEARSPSGWGVASNRDNILLWKTPTPNPPYKYGIYAEWNPCHDHNQMALVEEALARSAKLHEFYIAWDPKRQQWEGFCSPGLGEAGYPVFHESKLMAFALAVAEMMTKLRESKLGVSSKTNE